MRFIILLHQFFLKRAFAFYYCGLFCIFLTLRLYNISRDLHFDEIASLAVSQKSTLSILLGRYGDLGDMPLYYLVLKTITIFQNSEATLRIVSVLSAVSSLYVFFRICLVVFVKKSSTAFAVLLFSSSSIYMFYQQSARSYAFSVGAQLLLIFLLIMSKKMKYIWNTTAVLGALFIAVFSSFSSLYFFFIIPITWLADKSLKKTSIVSLTFLILITFLWHVQYRTSPEYTEALQNYFSKESVLSESVRDFVSTQFIFYPSWTGSFEITEFEESQSNSLYQFSIFIFFFSFGVVFSEMTKGKNKSLDRNIRIIATSLMFFYLIPVFISALSFNVMQLRLHLLVIPLMIILLVWILEKKHAKLVVRTHVLLLLFFFLYTNIFSIALSLGVKSYPIKNIIHSIRFAAEEKNTLCIASHGTAVHFYSYYIRDAMKCETFPLTFSNNSLYAVQKKQLNEKIASNIFERVVFLEYYSNRDEYVTSMLEKNHYNIELDIFPNAPVNALVYSKNQ